MALSGLDIYKLLPKTNCRECGFVTCLAFAMQLAKKAVAVDKCPYLGEESKKILQSASQPPIKLISFGYGDNKSEVGNETVLFRHEEKFHHPCAIGFIIEDALSDSQVKKKLEKINSLKFERVGQELKVNIIAVRQSKDAQRFLVVVKLVSQNSPLALMLMSQDQQALEKALEITKDKKPLVYPADVQDLAGVSQLCLKFKVPLVVSTVEPDKAANLVVELHNRGIEELAIEVSGKSISERLWNLTQIRRQALKKKNRALGYPALVIVDREDPYLEAAEAATYIAKYAGIILLRGIESWEVLSLLTLRQNIYTDPQKPLQIEPKLYPVGAAHENSPVLVTTNFSLTYYTVLGEVEASKIPSYILSVDTEGMSVLTAWAAEKFTPEKISDTIKKLAVTEAVKHRRMIIPGYVAVISGDLEDKSGWQVVVGPKEATGIPSFLKNL